MNTVSRLRGALACVVSNIALFGCAGGLQHTAIAPLPTTAVASGFDATEAGSATSLASSGDTLYVGSNKGITALKQGAKLWFHALPDAGVRRISAGSGLVGWSGSTLSGQEKVGNILLWVSGSAPVYSDIKIGLLDAAGNEKWTREPAGKETFAISAPAIGSSTVAFNRGQALEVYSLADGTPIASSSTVGGGLLKSVIQKAASVNVPLDPAAWQGGFYTSCLSTMFQFDSQGKKMDDRTNFGLFTPFGFSITAGPVMDNGRVFVVSGDASTDGNNQYTRVFSVKPDKFSSDWDVKYKKDGASSGGDIAIAGGRVFVSTNFHLIAYAQKDGDKIWAIEGPAVKSSSARGVRYGSWGQNIPVRKTFGNLIAADANKVYLASSLGKTGEGITILSAADGSYQKTVSVEGTILGLQRVGDQIAILTTLGVSLYK